MANNSQSRKWALVINNPEKVGFTHEIIIEKLMQFVPTYFCLADEISDTGTYHTHVFLYSESPIRFSTLKNRFPIAHLEKAFGSAQENRDYVTKSGKWAETAKAETSVEDTFFESGVMPAEKQEADPVMFDLVQKVRDGVSTVEIIDDKPKMAFRVKEIDILRQAFMAHRYISERRALEVIYIHGETGIGKTRYIYDVHDPKEICRITNYREGRGIVFDGYNGQDVLVFEEFQSQIPIGEMLNYLDIYPLSLPARYTDRVACFTKVYITSNLPIEAQYLREQKMKSEVWRAFRRRVHRVLEFTKDGTVIERREAI